MKKYLSCVILIVACIVCAMVFYVNARTPQDDDTSSSEQESEQSQIESSSTTPERVLAFSENGTLTSEYFCSSRLRIEWNSCKYEDESSLYINVELYLDSPSGINRECTGYLIVNGQRNDFSLNPSKEVSSLLCATSCELADFKGGTIEASGCLNLEFVGDGGVALNSLSIDGKIYQDASGQASQSHLLSVEHISQYPSLPSGDEITSLAMVLRYLKYNVDECDLCDLYLDKGPVGFTDFYKANAGNPRDTYNSYGCLAPVIVNSATKFINANGGAHIAYDYTGYNVSELYRHVSLGSPVIVWLCDDFENTPSISRIWVVDGKTLYLKSNMACMVLIGYDNTKNTVTLSDPAGGIFSVDKDLFELRFAQMGSYAVTVH